MPIIKSKPRTMEDGTNIISYTDSVGPSYVTYTFEKNQECLIIRNKGIKPIVYSVGTTTDVTLKPGEEHQIDAVFNSFKVKSTAGVQAFEIRADEEGTVGLSPGLAQEVNKLSSQLAQTEKDTTVPFRVIAEENAKNWIPNAKTPLNIPTYDGSGQTTHPSVLYFPNGWNGYKYWMCHTPYPFGDNQKENPSISASNDNVTWVDPAPNPIAPLPADKGFQSDGNIFMRGNTMEMWWRATTNIDGTLVTEIFRKTTTDGVNWSPIELLFDNRNWNVVRSPAVRYMNGKYCMWYDTDINGVYYIKYAESVDGKNWTNDRILDIEIKVGNQYMWHLDILFDQGKYEMVIVTEEQFGDNAIYYTSSLDNVSYSKPIMIMQPTKGSGNHDGNKLYKPSMIKVDGDYNLYYGSISEVGEFRVGLSKGSSPLLLGLDDTDKKEIRTIRYWKSNEFVASDSISKYPKNQITITKILGVGHGFPVQDGIAITDTTYANNGVRDQVIKELHGSKMYRRYVKSDGTWSSFILVNKVLPSEGQKLVGESTIPAYSTIDKTVTFNEVSVGDTIIGTPTSTLESGLIYNVVVSAANTVSIRIANITSTTIVMATRNWNFTVIKKG